MPRRKGSSRTPDARRLSRGLSRLVAEASGHGLGLRSGVPAIACCSAGALVFAMASPFLVKPAIDELASGMDGGAIYAYAFALLAFAGLQGLFDWARLYLMARFGQKIILDLRIRLFRQLTALPLCFFDRTGTGDLVTRLTSDMEILSLFYTKAFLLSAGNVLFLLCILPAMAWWSIRLSLVYLALLPFIALSVAVFSSKVAPLMRRSRSSASALTSVLRNGLAGLETVKGLACEDAVLSSIADSSDRLCRHRTEAGFAVARWRSLPSFLNALGAALVLAIGSGYVVRGTMTIGTLVGFTSFFGLLGRPIRQTGFLASVILRAVSSAERVFEILDRSEEADPPGAADLPEGPGLVRCESVGFSYEDGSFRLQDIDVEFRPGEVTVIVGASGSGKTTLALLLPRFYRPDSGRITMDGVDTARVRVTSLRRKIGIAFQESFIFDGSLRDNLSWSKPGASDEEMMEALEKAALGTFVRGLPRGLDTDLGDRGTRLSGGQRQRVALARTLLYDPSVLLLDEPASSVDPVATEALGRAISNVRENKTVIVVAHRFQTVRLADHLVVLEAGRLVEEARSDGELSAHDRLLQADGVYARLFGAFTRHREQAALPPGREYRIGRYGSGAGGER